MKSSQQRARHPRRLFLPDDIYGYLTIQRRVTPSPFTANFLIHGRDVRVFKLPVDSR